MSYTMQLQLLYILQQMIPLILALNSKVFNRRQENIELFFGNQSASSANHFGATHSKSGIPGILNDISTVPVLQTMDQKTSRELLTTWAFTPLTSLSSQLSSGIVSSADKTKYLTHMSQSRSMKVITGEDTLSTSIYVLTYTQPGLKTGSPYVSKTDDYSHEYSYNTLTRTVGDTESENVAYFTTYPQSQDTSSKGLPDYSQAISAIPQTQQEKSKLESSAWKGGLYITNNEGQISSNRTLTSKDIISPTLTSISGRVSSRLTELSIASPSLTAASPEPIPYSIIFTAIHTTSVTEKDMASYIESASTHSINDNAAQNPDIGESSISAVSSHWKTGLTFAYGSPSLYSSISILDSTFRMGNNVYTVLTTTESSSKPQTGSDLNRGLQLAAQIKVTSQASDVFHRTQEAPYSMTGLTLTTNGIYSLDIWTVYLTASLIESNSGNLPTTFTTECLKTSHTADSDIPSATGESGIESNDGSHKVEKRSVLVSVGVISVAVLLSVTIFMTARYRNKHRGVIRVGYPKPYANPNPNISHFSLDS